jgi:O-antigen ligase
MNAQATHRTPGPAWLPAAMAWLLVVTMVCPEDFNYQSGDTMPTSGSITSRLIWLSLLGASVVIAFWQMPRVKAVLRRTNPWLWGFFFLALASTAWSDDPATTLRRMLRFAAFLGVALAMVLPGWGPRRFQEVLRPVLAVLLAGSVLFALSSPTLAIEQLDQAELAGAWKGLAMQKNGLGSLAALGVILWLHALRTRSGKPLLNFLGLGLAVLCLVKSRSSTSLFAAAFASAAMFMMQQTSPALRRYMPYLVGSFTGLLLLYSIAVMNVVPHLAFILKPVTMLSGKDLSFSGRTAIWDILRNHMAYHPWLGSGYGAYWRGILPGTPSFEMVARLYFYPTEGHNGYLDVLNDLGWAGGVVLVGFLVTHLRQCLQLLKVDRAQGSLFLALLFQQMIANLSESRWFNVLSVEFVFQVMAALCVARALQEAQERPAYARPPAAAPGRRRAATAPGRRGIGVQ